MDSRKCYASLVKLYTVYKLKRMDPGPARLYLLCFAYDRFRQINDNLIEAKHFRQHARGSRKYLINSQICLNA